MQQFSLDRRRLLSDSEKSAMNALSAVLPRDAMLARYTVCYASVSEEL